MSGASIYTGLWTDYTQGSVLGRTLTLTTQGGDYLISALALFVAYVGSLVWLTVALAVHQLSVRSSHQDLLHEEFQIAYRNSESPTSLIWSLLKIGWAWTANPRKIYDGSLKRRTLVRILPPLSIGAAFTACGVLVAWVARPQYGSSDVLLQAGPNCGILDTDLTQLSSGSAALTGRTRRLASNARRAWEYARSCYPTGTQSLGDCAFYPKAHLHYSASTASCPFGDDATGPLCSYFGRDNAQSPALLTYTDVLDSSADLGINAPKGDSLYWQWNVTCSPLDVSQFRIKTKNPYGDGWLYIFDMGPNNLNPYTLYYPYNPNQNEEVRLGYQLISINDYAHDAYTWEPSRPFQTGYNTLTSLIFLMPNGVEYLSPVDDPLFAAHRVVSTQPNANYTLNLYLPDQPISVLGCVEQYAITNPANKRTVVGSITNIWKKLDGLALTASQNVTAVRLGNAFFDATILKITSVLGDSGLLAKDVLVDELTSAKLPPDQWKHEVKAWFETSLALIQRAIVDYSNAPKPLPPGTYLYSPNQTAAIADAAKAQCVQQRVRNNANYQSYSFTGIMLIVSLGCFLIIVQWLSGFLLGRKRQRWSTDRSRTRAAALTTDHILHAVHNRHSSDATIHIELGKSNVPVSVFRLTKKTATESASDMLSHALQNEENVSNNKFESSSDSSNNVAATSEARVKVDTMDYQMSGARNSQNSSTVSSAIDEVHSESSAHSLSLAPTLPPITTVSALLDSSD